MRNIVLAYVSLILKGIRCYKEVPKEIKDEVREVLIQMDREDLIYVE